MDRLGLARIWSVDRKVVIGCGFLASPSLVITCTHIFKDQRFSDPPEKGAGPITVEFICDDRLPPRQPIERIAHVRVAYPTNDANGPGRSVDVTEDITLLDLDKPLDPGDVLTFFNYEEIEALDGHAVRSLGFPLTHKRLGLAALGKVNGANAGVPQLQTDPPIKKLFSGGAVWDDDLEAFVGMVVAADMDVLSRDSCIIPTRYILEAFPELQLTDVKIVRREKIDRAQTARLAHLCNRTPQEMRIGEVVKPHMEQPASYAVQTFIIHGNNQEAIDRFVERLGLDALPEILKVPKPLPSRVIEWGGASIYAGEPDRAASVRNYMKDRVGQLGLHSTDPNPMVVETQILGREFKPGAGEILREYIDFWANFRLPVARRVIVCLGLRYTVPEPARGLARLVRKLRSKLRTTNDEELRGFVDTLEKSPPPNTTVLKELKSVEQGEAEDWTGKVKHRCDISREDVGKIYERSDADWKFGGPIPMRLLAPELERLLIRQMVIDSERR